MCCKYLTTQPNTKTRSYNRNAQQIQHNQIRKCATNTRNTTKYKKCAAKTETRQILATQPNRETRCKYRNALQILTTQPNTKTRSYNRNAQQIQHNQIRKCATNTRNTTKYKKCAAKTETRQILATQPNTEMCCKYVQTTTESLRKLTMALLPKKPPKKHGYYS